MRGIGTHRLKSGHEPTDFAAIHRAHRGFAPVPMQMNVKNAFTSRATVIDSLHCPYKSFAADSRADGSIVDVLVIWNRMVMSEEDNLAPARERPYTTKDKSDSLCRKRVWSREVSQDLAIKSVDHLDFDSHLSLAKPSR